MSNKQEIDQKYFGKYCHEKNKRIEAEEHIQELKGELELREHFIEQYVKAFGFLFQQDWFADNYHLIKKDLGKYLKHGKIK